MNNNLGKMIYGGKMIDLSKAENSELENLINDLENEQMNKKKNIKSILDKMGEEF